MNSLLQALDPNAVRSDTPSQHTTGSVTVPVGGNLFPTARRRQNRFGNQFLLQIGMNSLLQDLRLTSDPITARYRQNRFGNKFPPTRSAFDLRPPIRTRPAPTSDAPITRWLLAVRVAGARWFVYGQLPDSGNCICQGQCLTKRSKCRFSTSFYLLRVPQFC
jgi:hypothetical protein